MEYPNLTRVLNELSDYVQDEYKRKLKEQHGRIGVKGFYIQDAYASGELYNSVDVKVKKSEDGYMVWFSALDYWLNVEDGRKPGVGVSDKYLIPWMINREIEPANKSTAFLISRSIKEYGIKARPFLGEIESNLLDEWGNKIVEAARTDLYNGFYIEYKKGIQKFFNEEKEYLQLKITF